MYQRPTCPMCHKAYKNANTLKSHISQDCGKLIRTLLAILSRPTTTSCRTRVSVDREFSSDGGLYGETRKAFACPNCDKSYTLYHNLKRHRKIECGKAKTFHCPYCPRSYYYKSDHRIHVMRHEMKQFN
ncbi:PREDICTED: zinc finger protein 425-like [Nicrophorus vespilloides]|uniref:Zinc finger protein 425-like n=1 Tax=Nicrophorus vespilloides TaxID=110193 RepID=A0ABM1N9H6_NICVS|nr:PREDICTED: zinc finger protein 425-like [Nicrophorus vespilloides]